VMHFRNTLSQMWTNIQLTLFPLMERTCGILCDQYKELISILELIRIEEHLLSGNFRLGRPSKDRAFLARAFVSKMFLKIPTTKQLIQKLKSDSQFKNICGGGINIDIIPSESKFSRAFEEFAEYSLPERVHKALVKEVYKDKIVGHLVTDSMPLEAREAPLNKPSKEERKKIKNRRQKKERNGELNRRQRQQTQTLNEMIEDLPKACDIGRKRSAKGCGMSWKGYKLHISMEDHSIPVAAILTSASVNDSEVAIPMACKANNVVKNFYDIMDAAYDHKEIKEYSLFLGHIPIIDKCAHNKSQKEEILNERKRCKLLNFKTAEKIRYANRFPKERCNALYKDYYGGKTTLYRGHSKIFCHVMFGLLAMTGMMLLKLSQ
jgi:hypothetical protein